MRRHATSELTFEPPPLLPWPAERRLSERAVAVWEAACKDGRAPAAADFTGCELAVFCADNSVGIVATDEGPRVSSVGAAVAAVFDLVSGNLAGTAAPLAAQLGRSFVELRCSRAPVSFAADLSGCQSGASLLTRGVLLPLLDDGGLLSQALAIVTWKEILDSAASNLLNSEVGGAIAVGRATRQLPGWESPSTLYAAFEAEPDAGQDRAAASRPIRPQRSIIAR